MAAILNDQYSSICTELKTKVEEKFLEELMTDKDNLFLRFWNASGGKVVAQGERWVGYSTVATQLKEFF